MPLRPLLALLALAATLVLVVGGAWLAGRRVTVGPGVPVTVPPQAAPVVPAAR